MDIVFCKTKYKYDSYEDFWRLVTASGFPTIYVDEIDPSQETVFIFTPWNGEAFPVLEAMKAVQHQKAKIVLWMLERDICDKGITPEFDRMSKLVDAIWVSDRSYARLDSRLTHVVLGSHPDLTTVPLLGSYNYDVCVLAYLWGRRQTIVDQLIQNNVSIAPPAYGKEAQDKIIPSSRIILNMHQYPDAQIIAPLRFAIAAAYGLPVLTESVDDAYPLTENVDFVAAPYENLVEATKTLLNDHSLQEHIAANLQQKLLVDWRFDISVKRAVERLFLL